MTEPIRGNASFPDIVLEPSQNAGRITARAVVALGSADKAVRWMRKENRALDGSRPIDLIHTAAGVERVERVLGRIEHGIYS
ncbi:MAG TPA: MbcA/ParS/Xre antitoxin family protein [Longimicrobium sp.]|nr:MbcA/ParS/Xre antitoxin family protein [Longimicrobium sp.]